MSKRAWIKKPSATLDFSTTCIGWRAPERVPLDTMTRTLMSHMPLAPPERAPACSLSPRRCPFGGTCHTCPLDIQAKLTVSRPGDPYEQEADRVADQVLRMPAPQVQRQEAEPEEEAKPEGAQAKPAGHVQRQAEEPEEDEEETAQRQAKEPEEDEEETAQAKPVGHAPTVTPSIQAQIDALRGGGQPLSASTRGFFEPRFGRDFGGVRIHTDVHAAATARALNARAFTLGRDVVFGAGEYAPGTGEGRKLLAHELTHVVQHGAADTFSTVKASANSWTTTQAFIQCKQATLAKEQAKAGWAGTEEQVKFMEEVLREAIASKGRYPYSDLEASDLGKVPGAGTVTVRAEIAPEAGRFLAEAKKDLQAARVGAEQVKKAKGKSQLKNIERDILDTVDVRISGYRSVREEVVLWRKYFPGYYNRTLGERAKLSDPHGKAAVKHMVRFIAGKKAPPGFSKHTLGVAIDFYQKRMVNSRGRMVAQWVNNSTKQGNKTGQIGWWHHTWLYQWLCTHAGAFGFTQLKTEPWHYDYTAREAQENHLRAEMPSKVGNKPHPRPM